MAGMEPEPEPIRLDTVLYIGIGVDVFLAIIAGVLVYRWRQKKKEEDARSRQVDGIYGASQGTELETVPMDSRSMSRVVGPDTARHNYDYTNPLYESVDRTSVPGKNEDADSEGVRNSLTNSVLDPSPEDPGYPPLRNDRVVQNPLAGSALSPNPLEPEHVQEGDMAVSTYYTYKPPEKQLDGESSEIVSQGERSSVSSPPPPEYIEIDDEGSRPPSALPSPLPVLEDNEYSYPDESSTANDRTSTKSSSTLTLNFTEESVAKLYTTDYDESTSIM